MQVNSLGLAAFDSPNFPPLATLGAFIKENKVFLGPFALLIYLTITINIVSIFSLLVPIKYLSDSYSQIPVDKHFIKKSRDFYNHQAIIVL